MKPSSSLETAIKGKEKYLILEIGNYNTKMIEVEPLSAKIAVNKGFIVATPEGTIDDDVVVNSKELIDILKEKIQEEKITSRQVTISLSSKDIITRELAVPKMSSRDMISFIKVNSKDLFPVNLEDYTLGYVSMSKEEKSKLLIIAIPNDIIVPYIDITQKLGLVLKSINFSGFELYNLIDFELGKEAGTYAVIDLGSKNTNFIIVSRGNLMYNRVIKVGSDDVTKAIAEKFKCTLTKAEKIKRDYNSVITEGSLKPNDDVYVVANIFKEVLGGMLADIANLIEFYNANHLKTMVSKAYIIGLATKISGISEFAEETLGMPTEKIKEFERVVFDEKAKQVKRRQVTLENCLGAVAIDEKKVNLIKGKLQLANIYQNINPMVYKIGVAIACCMVLVLAIIYYLTFTIETDAMEYDIKIAEVTEIAHLQGKYKEANKKLSDNKKMIDGISNGIEKKKEVLENLEDANAVTPSVFISKYTVNLPNKVTVVCTSPDEFTSYDFDGALQQYFETPENLPFSKQNSFTLQLVEK